VADAWARTRARERIEAIGTAPLDSTGLRRQALAVLREVVDFDAYVWLLTDPVTAVGAAPLADVPCMPELPALIKAKYATAVNRWTDLRQRTSPTALLNDVVGGDLAQSRVWREVMSRYGIQDVASTVFADRFGCWGFLDLWRDQMSGPFIPSDAAFIDSVTGSLTTALRECHARTFVEAAAPRRRGLGPVVLTLDEDLQITSRTAASQSWLDALLTPGSEGHAIPASVYNVAAQLLAVEAGIDDHPASTRVYLSDGFWLTLRAARLAFDPPESDSLTPGTGNIVVTIEEASATERMDLFARAVGLTARECELLGWLATGSDTRAMARQMSLSEHTIQDHLKSIFTKTGSRDRVSVLSRVLGTKSGPHPRPRGVVGGEG